MTERAWGASKKKKAFVWISTDEDSYICGIETMVCIEECGVRAGMGAHSSKILGFESGDKEVGLPCAPQVERVYRATNVSVGSTPRRESTSILELSAFSANFSPPVHCSRGLGNPLLLVSIRYSPEGSWVLIASNPFFENLKNAFVGLKAANTQPFQIVSQNHRV